MHLQEPDIFFASRSRTENDPVHVLAQRSRDGLPLHCRLFIRIKNNGIIALSLQKRLHFLYHDGKMGVGYVSHNNGDISAHT